MQTKHLEKDQVIARLDPALFETALLQARAIENQCYVAAVNRVGADGNGIHHSGDSMLVDPLGEIVATCSQEEWIHTAVIEKKVLNTIRAQFPFLKDADLFSLE